MSSTFSSLLLIALVLLATAVDGVSASGDKCVCKPQTNTVRKRHIAAAGMLNNSRSYQTELLIAVAVASVTIIAFVLCICSRRHKNAKKAFDLEAGRRAYADASGKKFYERIAVPSPSRRI